MELDNFVGKIYKLVKTDSCEEFCDFMKYSDSKRKKFNTDHTIVLKKGCFGYYDFVEKKAKFTTTICSIKNGMKFCGYSCSNGGWTKNEVIFEKNCLICMQKGKKDIKTVREFFDDQMIFTIFCENVQAKKYYKLSGINQSLIEINLKCIHENNLI